MCVCVCGCACEVRVIVKLGVSSAKIVGFDLDTGHFNGNESPACSVYGYLNSSSGMDPDNLKDTKPPSHDHSGWVELLPVVRLGPASRHLFVIDEDLEHTTHGYQYLKLHMIPDGQEELPSNLSSGLFIFQFKSLSSTVCLIAAIPSKVNFVLL